MINYLLESARALRAPGCFASHGTQEQEIKKSNSAREEDMAESVYKIIEVVGTSSESWERAATAAVERASKTLRDLRIAEIAQLDLQIGDGKVQAYRARVKLSFKFEE
jgi:dodecin